jgi:crotonobetainyl-CoA:carnitine CoA-transferase CaiB-like acyl-CoA transferase
MMNSNVYCNSDDAFSYEGKPPRRVPDQAQLGLEATYRLYETAAGWVFVAAQFDDEFAALVRALGRDDLVSDPRFATWKMRMANRQMLEAELAPIFRTRSADDWEAFLLERDVGCARADAASHVRFLHSDPQARAMGFMVMTQSPEFADKSPQGRYWRHAPVVRFSETPCEEGKSYQGPAAHTLSILRRLGYGEAAIDHLVAQKVVGVARRV